MATIYFAPNRNPNNAQPPTDFGKGFSDTGLGDLRFGLAKVKRGALDEWHLLKLLRGGRS